MEFENFFFFVFFQTVIIFPMYKIKFALRSILTKKSVQTSVCSAYNEQPSNARAALLRDKKTMMIIVYPFLGSSRAKKFFLKFFAYNVQLFIQHRSGMGSRKLFPSHIFTRINIFFRFIFWSWISGTVCKNRMFFLPFTILIMMCRCVCF